MQNNDNQKTYFIYVRSTGEKVPVTKEQHDSFYKEADRIRHKEQDHGRCMCPYRFIWRCDGDCLDCEYHAAGDITSLDQPLSDGNAEGFEVMLGGDCELETMIRALKFITKVLEEEAQEVYD